MFIIIAIVLLLTIIGSWRLFAETGKLNTTIALQGAALVGFLIWRFPEFVFCVVGFGLMLSAFVGALRKYEAESKQPRP